MARLPYVQEFRDRHGRTRRYYRRAGWPRVQLPGDVGSPEFLAAYQAAAERGRAPVGAKRTQAGTINELCVLIYQSSEWADLAEGTRVARRALLERFRAEHGDKRVSHLDGPRVRALLDRKRDTPQAANNLLKTLRFLMKFAIERGVIDRDPTEGIKKRKSQNPEGHHTWTEEEVAQYEAHWPIGTRERLAFDLMLYTSVRRSDAVLLGPQHVSAGRISILPQKTKTNPNPTRVSLPMHRTLARSIKATPIGLRAFIVTAAGKPFGAASFGNWFRDAVKATGLPDTCRAHGLRKASARRLAEAGATAHQIAAVTGHTTLAEVERYTRAADRQRLADEALRTVGEQPTVKPDPEV